MTIFGIKSEFAIEIDEEQGEEDIYYFCFWCHGLQIGDFTRSVYIKYCINYIREFLEYAQERHLKDSFMLSKERLFYELYDGMMVLDDLPYIKSYDIISDMDFGKKRIIFHMDGIGECSFRDLFSVILVNEYEKNRQRLLWRDYRNTILYEEFLPMNCVDNVLIEFMRFFKQDVSQYNIS